MNQAIFNAAETVTASELNSVTGIYPQLAYAWRKTHGFPYPNRTHGYNLAEIVSWLRDSGWNVEIV